MIKITMKMTYKMKAIQLIISNEIEPIRNTDGQPASSIKLLHYTNKIQIRNLHEKYCAMDHHPNIDSKIVDIKETNM